MKSAPAVVHKERYSSDTATFGNFLEYSAKALQSTYAEILTPQRQTNTPVLILDSSVSGAFDKVPIHTLFGRNPLTLNG